MEYIHFKPENLKLAQPKLEPIDNYILMPLMDIVLDKWPNQLSIDKIVTDHRELLHGDFYRQNLTHIFVLNGLMVDVNVSYADIDYEDDDESWFMANEAIFECSIKEPAEKLYNHLFEFSKKQDLADLIGQAKSELQRGKTYHLKQDLKDFYFKYNSLFDN